VIESDPAEGGASAWRRARQAERLFWRHFGTEHPARELWAHAGVVLEEFARKLPHPGAVAALAGRLVGLCERRKYRIGHVGGGSAPHSYGELAAKGAGHGSRAPAQRDAQQRVDSGHGLAGPHSKTPQSSRPRATLTRSGMRFCRGE
jgi:hypothetical protein